MVALAGCNKMGGSSAPYKHGVTAANRVGAGGIPGINFTAALGIAFAYGYDFVLPDKGIGALQEAHAAACEKLGVSQWRITTLRYSLLEHDRATAYDLSSCARLGAR